MVILKDCSGVYVGLPPNFLSNASDCVTHMHGSLLSPAEECNALAEHARKLFDGTVHQYPALQPLPNEIFAPGAWSWALSKIRSQKAVPRNEPTVQAWKDGNHQAASTLASIAQKALCGPNPELLIEWSTVQLAWLPKPNKSPTTPANLRSIGLLPTASKALLLILRREVTPYIRAGLVEVPQYAYRRQASTHDALLRASPPLRRGSGPTGATSERSYQQNFG